MQQILNLLIALAVFNKQMQAGKNSFLNFFTYLFSPFYIQQVQLVVLSKFFKSKLIKINSKCTRWYW